MRWRATLLVVSGALLAVGLGASPPAFEGSTILAAGNSIQAAVDVAPPGAIIDLAAGTYRESLVIGRSLTLRGSCEGTSIEGTRPGPVVQIVGVGVSVRMENLTIRGGLGWNGHGIQTEGSVHVDLEDVTVMGNSWCGIWATDRSVLTLRGCRIVENGTHGVYTWDFARLDARGCEVSRNKTHAILAFHISELWLLDCTISDNLSGVWAWDGVRFHAARIQVVDNALNGLVGQNGALLDLANCVVDRNGEYGLWFTDSSRGVIHACSISGNGDDGVFVELDGIVDFVGCTIAANAGIGIRAAASSCVGGFVSGAPYKGWIEGSANVVPGPDEMGGNLVAALCPVYPGSIWPSGFLIDGSEVRSP